jgi:FG-GAP repeat
MKRNGRFSTTCLLLLALGALTACGGGGGEGGETPPASTAAGGSTGGGGTGGGGTGGGGGSNTGSCGDGVSTGVGPFISAQQAYVKASNAQALDGFGGAVALSANGNVLVAGARGDWKGDNGFAANTGAAPTSTGAAYVFTRSVTTWTQGAHLQPSSLNVGDGFGVAVAVSGDGNTIAIGAYRDSSVASTSGAVYVFVCSAGAWSQEAYLKASNAASSDQFGAIVSLSADGNTLAVGAPGEDSPGAGNSGAVYVFTRSAAAWAEQAYVKASNAGADDAFGSAVRLSSDGNTLAVGAFNEGSAATGVNGDQANDAALGSGAVYVFTRSGAAWSQQAYVKASNTDAGDNFGLHLALSGDGDTLAVGARGEASTATGIGGNQADNLAPLAGAAYVFTRSQGSWTQQAYVKASNAQADDRFGRSITLSGDGNVLFVGAVDEASSATGIEGNQASNSASLSGAVYEFVRSAGLWAQVRYIKASNTGRTDFFGWSIAVSSDASTLAVGGPDEDSAATSIGGDQTDESASSAGAVYVFQ